MSTITKQTTTVRGFHPITCVGCGHEAAISTKVGQTIECLCGVRHTPIAIVVESEGECDPNAHAAKAAADRAARMAPKAEANS